MKKLLQIALCASVILPAVGFSYSSANRNIQYPKAIYLYKSQDGGVYTSDWYAYPLNGDEDGVTVAVEPVGKQAGWTIFRIDCTNVSNSDVLLTNGYESYLSIDDYVSKYGRKTLVNKVLQKFCK